MNITPSFWPFVGAPVLVGSSIIVGYSVYEFFEDIMPRWKAIIAINEKRVLNSDKGKLDSYLVYKLWGKYLVDSKENESWWRWSYMMNYVNVYYQTDIFKVVNKAYVAHGREPDKEALNQACEHLYLKAAEKLNDKERSDIWTFCSPGGVKLESLANNNYIQTWSLAKELNNKEDLKKHLVNTRYVGNIWFWELRQDELDGGSLEEDNRYFKKGTSIRRTCDSIYRGEILFRFEKHQDQLIQYCGLRHI